MQQAKILGTAVPGETVTLRAAVQGRSAGLVLIEGSACIGDLTVLTTRLTLSGVVVP